MARKTDRREFLACLLAVLANASSPAIAAPTNVQRFVIKRSGVRPGTQIWAAAEAVDNGRPYLDRIYHIRALVTAVKQVTPDCYVWGIEHEPGHDVFWFTALTGGHVDVAPADIPDWMINHAQRRAAERDFYWLTDNTAGRRHADEETEE